LNLNLQANETKLNVKNSKTTEKNQPSN